MKSPATWAAIKARRSGAAQESAPPKTYDLARIKAERARVLGRHERLQAPITRVLPVPRAIPLGPGLRVVNEMRLRHLAELQAYLEEADPHPLDGLDPAWADADPATRPARLKAAWDRAGEWPARLGTSRGSILLGSPAGRANFLALNVREYDPGFGLTEALELLPRVTPSQWARLVRIAWAIHPRMEIAAELAPDTSPAKPSDWWKQAHAAAGEYAAALVFPQLGELYLGQWRCLCSGGKALEFTKDYSDAMRRVNLAMGW
jgi:hypothetical protein